VSDLIDTTEMYLRTVFELEEEGVRPMRARIAERLEQSGPTVSQTVARMERDGLLKVEDDRHLELTESGRAIAQQVMRRHRLAECLLVEVLKVPLAEVHEEACRWEHVMSENVERRISQLLNNPTHSPFGNPIPGIATDAVSAQSFMTLADCAAQGVTSVTVKRLSEPVQDDQTLMAKFEEIGLLPGAEAHVAAGKQGVVCELSTGSIEISNANAVHIFVTAN
jgi:DtxR family Mn-dependent transcriptional regulator